MAEEKAIGEVTHYFDHISVAIVKLSAPLVLGEEIHIKGHTTDLTQKVDSMQLEHEQIESGKPGESVGIKVSEHVREGDEVYKSGTE